MSISMNVYILCARLLGKTLYHFVIFKICHVCWKQMKKGYAACILGALCLELRMLCSAGWFDKHCNHWTLLSRLLHLQKMKIFHKFSSINSWKFCTVYHPNASRRIAWQEIIKKKCEQKLLRLFILRRRRKNDIKTTLTNNRLVDSFELYVGKNRFNEIRQYCAEPRYFLLKGTLEYFIYHTFYRCVDHVIFLCIDRCLRWSMVHTHVYVSRTQLCEIQKYTSK